jgi:hypothetical protein
MGMLARTSRMNLAVVLSTKRNTTMTALTAVVGSRTRIRKTTLKTTYPGPASLESQ